MSEFKVIETQEELNRIVEERLKREREKYADYDELKNKVVSLEKENDSLQSTLEAIKKEKSGFEEQVKDLQGQVTNYETSALRTRVALENGLPYDLADRLQGADETELKADAERFAAFMKPTERTPPLKDTEPANIGNDRQANLTTMLKELTQDKGE